VTKIVKASVFILFAVAIAIAALQGERIAP